MIKEKRYSSLDVFKLTPTNESIDLSNINILKGNGVVIIVRSKQDEEFEAELMKHEGMVLLADNCTSFKFIGGLDVNQNTEDK